MKIGDYITAEDWNALGREKQLALRDGLRFMGYRVSDTWFPEEVMHITKMAYLYKSGDLASSFYARTILGDRFTIQDINQFIELTSFQVS